MPRTDSRKKSAAPPPPSGSAAPTAPAAGNPSMAPRGQFNRRQEGQRFLAPLKSIAPNPRNLREEWEFETDEFEEFRKNVENTELIQDPAVSSVDAFVAKYPQHAGEFGSDVEWVLLAGERRYRAALQTKTPEDTIPVVLRDKLLEKGDFVLWSENNYRKGWDPIQEAQLLERMRREENLTYDEILDRLGGAISAIKRRSDISKRIKLLDLQDGPLRRAIRQREIGLEPAYTLVSRLKEPALIEQGWSLMQTQEVTAKIACDTLLDKTAVPTQEDPAQPSPVPPANPPVVDSALLVSVETEGTAIPVRPEPSAGAESFVDETSRAPRVPTQGSTPGPATGARGTTGAGFNRSENTGRWNAQRDIAARLAACAKVLTSRTWPSLDEDVRKVAVHALLEASGPAFEIACQIAGGPELTDSDRLGYVAALEADGSVFMMAYAVVLATDELCLRAAGDDLDARATAYLKRLHDGAEFDTAGYQTALVAVSSAKL